MRIQALRRAGGVSTAAVHVVHNTCFWQWLHVHQGHKDTASQIALRICSTITEHNGEILWVEHWAVGRDTHHVQACAQGRLRLADGHAWLLGLQVHRSTLRLTLCSEMATCSKLCRRRAVLAAGMNSKSKNRGLSPESSKDSFALARTLR